MQNREEAVELDQHARAGIKNEVAQKLILAMESGDTPWQRPWSQQAMRPINPTTQNAYRGVNRILLALSGRSSNEWCTVQQAAAKGWRIRKGERGTMIIKVVDLASPGTGQASASPGEASRPIIEGPEQDAKQPGGMALKRYWVFNSEQIEGMPQLEEEPQADVEPVTKAEAIVQALTEQTGLIVVHGGNTACYVPALDEVRLPPVRSFHSQYDMWATKLHECAHSTMHAKRLNRTEAYAKRWGDEAYALEELTAEIASAIMAGETGVPMSQDPGHLQSHASYLRSWVKLIDKDPMAIFTAAKNADRICEYMLGLERKKAANEQSKEWLAEYDRTAALMRA
jgi:antirestriction protein ArdC